MYQEILIGSSKILLPSGNELQLFYYVIRSDKRGDEQQDMYGIRIISYDKASKTTQTDQQLSISQSRDVVEELCYSLILNHVTPVSLREVIEDYL